MTRKAVAACVGDGMVVRRIVMPARDVVFFKGIVEASEGLAAVFAEKGGDLTVAAPASRAGELDGLLDDLAAEIRFVRVAADASTAAIVAAR
jgi:Domain of unknown function (DUF4911)